MISCEHAQNLFDAYLNDELSPHLQAELDAHRLECSICRQQLTLMEACANVVHLDADEPQVSGDFTDRLMAILEEDRSARNTLQISRKLRIAGGLLGIAAAIAVVVAMLRTPDPAPEVAGRQITPPRLESMVETMLSDFGVTFFDTVSGASEAFSSVLELGELSITKMAEPVDLPGADIHTLPPPPAQQEPELDVFQTLPELDDGGEVM